MEGAYERRVKEIKEQKDIPVNPEGLIPGDTISVSNRAGLFKVLWIVHEKGYLKYKPIGAPLFSDETSDETKELPIRQARFICRPTGEGQLPLPFIKESIESALGERGMELVRIREEQKERGFRRSSKKGKKINKQDQDLRDLLKKAMNVLGKEELDKLLK